VVPRMPEPNATALLLLDDYSLLLFGHGLRATQGPQHEQRLDGALLGWHLGGGEGGPAVQLIKQLPKDVLTEAGGPLGKRVHHLQGPPKPIKLHGGLLADPGGDLVVLLEQGLFLGINQHQLQLSIHGVTC
jgi:hypothetical protein